MSKTEAPGVRLRQLGFSQEDFREGRVGWVSRRRVGDRECEILITDGDTSTHLPYRARDRALMTINPIEESEHWISIELQLSVMVDGLEFGELIAPANATPRW